MRNSKIFVIIIISLLPMAAAGQIYNSMTINRPAALNWQEIKTDHFRIIFPDGEDSLAYRSAAILESHYAKTSALTGGKLQNFPVILNNYNDLSNGFVSSINFRSEVDLSPFKGKGMNPQTGDWLETVLPHELVHATHFNIQIPFEDKKTSIPNLVSLFSPDFARSFHGFPPVGLHEGLAVYYETESVAPMGGRGNYTFSTNRFNSNFSGNDRWSMGQTLIPSDYTLPYNRHYIAGYSFVDWLHEEFGDEISKETIRYHYHNFYLGYGFALRMKTGKWPGQLYELYEEDLEAEEENRQSRISINTTKKSKIIKTPFHGEEVHAPKWINDKEILFYGSYYNGRLGFYRYHTATQNFSLVKETFGVGDYNYEIDPDGKLLYSAYKLDPLFPGVFNTELRVLDLRSGEVNKVGNQSRIIAPTSNGDRIVAIRVEDLDGEIIEVLPDGDLSVLKNLSNATPVSLEFDPKNPEQLAVVINKRGVQALWITTLNSLEEDLSGHPDIAFKNASVFDPEWHPIENKVMFTVDRAPAMNVYEYDLDEEEIYQLSSSLFNAFEASYSPQGDQIAYIVQEGDQRKMAILNRDNFLNDRISSSALLTGNELETELSRPLLGHEIIDSIKRAEKGSYRPGPDWLKPRAILPVYREKAGTPQYGIEFSSIDPLSSQAYSMEITGIQSRLWYDLTYTNKTFYPGFELSAYSEPQFFVSQNPATEQPYSIMRQDRGFSLALPFQYNLRGDTRFSGITFKPEVKAEQFRYFDLEPATISDFATRYRAGLFSQVSFGILNLPRGIQPSSGISFFGLYEQTLNEPEVEIQFPGARVSSTFRDQWAALYGAFGYVSPLRKWNQSLRLDLQFLTQSDSPIYSNDTIIPMGFSEDILPNYDSRSDTGFQNIGRFSTRYVIPVFYPDNGGLTVPLYLSSIYLTAFSHTLTDMDSNDLVSSSRSVFGGGLHVQFKLSNLLFDVGIGVAYEPSRNKTQLILGEF